MFKPKKENSSYLVGVDTSKEGIDAFTIQVIDMTKFPFEQVAEAKLQVDYLTMPEYLHLDTR